MFLTSMNVARYVRNDSLYCCQLGNKFKHKKSVEEILWMVLCLIKFLWIYANCKNQA